MSPYRPEGVRVTPLHLWSRRTGQSPGSATQDLMVMVAPVLAVYVSEMMRWHDADISYLRAFGRCIFASGVRVCWSLIEVGLIGK